MTLALALERPVESVSVADVMLVETVFVLIRFADVMFVEIKFGVLRLVDTFAEPFTSKCVEGLVVPIPILPLDCTNKLG